MKLMCGLTTSNQIIISMLDNYPIQRLEAHLGDRKITRVNYNAPILIGQGAIAYCANKNTDAKDIEIVQAIFDSVGVAHRVQESQFSAITGLSGSIPAQVFLLIEALADGGVK